MRFSFTFFFPPQFSYSLSSELNNSYLKLNCRSMLRHTHRLQNKNFHRRLPLTLYSVCILPSLPPSTFHTANESPIQLLLHGTLYQACTPTYAFLLNTAGQGSPSPPSVLYYTLFLNVNCKPLWNNLIVSSIQCISQGNGGVTAICTSTPSLVHHLPVKVPWFPAGF